MKQLLILIGLFCSVWASAQTPPGYVRINQRAHQYAEAADMMNLPAGTTAAFGAGQWRRSGAVFVDTTGADAGVYYSIGTTWIKIFDETDAVGATLSNIGTGFDLAQYGTSNVKRLAFANGLTGDSATSQTVTARLGGTLVSNTTINAGNRQLNLKWDSLQSSTGGFYLTSTGTVNGQKILFGANITQTSTATTGVAVGVNSTVARLGTGGISFNTAYQGAASGGIQNRGLLLSVGHGIGASTSDISYGVNATAYSTGTITGRYGVGPLVGGYFLGDGGGRGSSTGWYGTSTYGIQALASLSHTSASADSTFTATAGDFTTVTNGSGTAIGARITSTYSSGIGGTPKLYGLIVRGATTEKPLSGFLATSNTPNSIVHIGPAAAGYSSLMIEETATPPSSPVDGMIWHQGDHIKARLNGVTVDLDGSGSGTTPTLQEVFDEGTTLDKANTIDQDGFLMQWLGPNRFYDSSATQVSIRDFNSGTDYTWYTPILGDTAGNVQMNVADGFKVTMTDGTESNLFQVNGNGIFGRGSGNFSASNLWMKPTQGDVQFMLGGVDTIGAVIRSGVRGINQYAVLYGVYDDDSSYVRARGDAGLKFRGGNAGIYEFENMPTYDGSGGQALVIDSDNKVYKTTISTDGTTVVIGSDVSSAASTSAQDITGMSFSVTSGVLYEFEAVILYTTTDNTIGASFGVNGPSSPTLVSFTTLTPQTATGIAQGSGGDYSLRGAANATPAGVATARVFGFIRPSSSGTFQIRFAPETATASGIVVKAGSRVKYWVRN